MSWNSFSQNGNLTLSNTLTSKSVVLESGGGGSITFQDGTVQTTANSGGSTNLVRDSLSTSISAASSGTNLTLFSETDLSGYNLALMTGTINFSYTNCTITNVQITVIQVDEYGIFFNYIQSSQLTATTVALYNSTPFSVAFTPIAGAVVQVQVNLTYTGTNPLFLGTSSSAIPTSIQISYFG